MLHHYRHLLFLTRYVVLLDLNNFTVRGALGLIKPNSSPIVAVLMVKSMTTIDIIIGSMGDLYFVFIYGKMSW
jgi:hypothetical protein